MKNKTTALLLAIFFGGLGVHKFYLRDTGSGIFYLALTIMTGAFKWPVGYILGWIDAFRLLTMSDQAFDKKYNGRARNDRERGRRESTASL